MRPRPRSLQSISPPKPTWPGRSTWTPEAIGLNRSKVFEPAAVDLLVRATAGVPRSVFENIVVVIVCRSKRPDNVSPVQVQFSRIGASAAELKALRFGRHLDVADGVSEAGGGGTVEQSVQVERVVLQDGRLPLELLVTDLDVIPHPGRTPA